MSANGKRVLPTTAASTAALVPFSHPGYATGQPGRSGDSDELIDQLVGGLVQADRSAKSEANFFNQREDAGSYGRTYSIDDEEIDEPPVPIPSTWQAPTVAKEPSWLAEQLKASAYGFVIGLFVVIPAVMLLTGQTERLPSWAAVSQYASATATQFGVELNLNQTEPSGTLVASAEPSKSKTTIATNRTVTSEIATPTTGEMRKTSAPVVSNSTSSEQINVETAAPAAAQTSVSVTSVDTKEPSATSGETSSLATTDQQIAALTPPLKTILPSAAPSSQPKSTQAGQDATDPGAPPPAAPAATQSEAPSVSVSEGSSVANEQANALAEARANVLANNDTVTPSIAAETPESEVNTSGQSGDSMPDALTIETAQFLMKNGKMKDGRVILAKLASRGHAAAIFALAESFDPNVLASWGSSGMIAEPEKAKIFYSMALSQGVEAAIMRLKGLE
ncbi:MAG: hypothetical protein AAF709_02180 [Pseudomonadota bacterium]